MEPRACPRRGRPAATAFGAGAGWGAAGGVFVLETCMSSPFPTAKNLAGFGPDHSRLMRAFPRLQMILVLACDHAAPGNRVSVDAQGKPVVHYRFTGEVIAS